MDDQNQGLSYLPKLKAEVDNLGMRVNSWYRAKIKLNDCFIINFLNNLQKRTLLSEFQKFDNTI